MGTLKVYLRNVRTVERERECVCVSVLSAWRGMEVRFADLQYACIYIYVSKRIMNEWIRSINAN